MYNPQTARFLQEDTYTGEANDPLSLNLYTYCENNPIIYEDPSGHVIETIFDIASAADSLYQFAKKPSLKNAAYLVWDTASIVAPGVPGSYASKGAKVVSKLTKGVKHSKKVKNVGKTVKKTGRVVDKLSDGMKVSKKAPKVKKVVKTWMGKEKY